MPAEKPLTIAGYAAGASLAAITLVYVFGPTFFLDGDANAGTNKSSSRRPAVGLSNPANDCFINSVLQALAGLPELRKYLIRETHRRKLDGPHVYKVTDVELAEGIPEPRILLLEGLRSGVVTQALKTILDQLNERSLYKRTISAQAFIVALERAFRTRISRQQQDAQEFLQVVAERVCDEYHAGQEARKKARDTADANADASTRHDSPRGVGLGAEGEPADETCAVESSPESESTQKTDLEVPGAVTEEDGFPLEGKVESQIECQTCGFRPKPSISNFVTLTLNVPQSSSATLNQCIDGMFRVETIEDYRCDKCRLEHALACKKDQMLSGLASERKAALESDIESIQQALQHDPEKPPEGVELPSLSLAPARTIRKHMRISSFPKVLVVHLSRSIFSQFSSKNLAKVSFPEILPLGGLLDQKQYRLLSVVNHKGGHNTGHYETFRRQVTTVPFSTPHSFGTEGAYSRRSSPATSKLASPRLGAHVEEKRLSRVSTSTRMSRAYTDGAFSSESGPDSRSSSSRSSRSSLSLSGSQRPRTRPPTSAPRESNASDPSFANEDAVQRVKSSASVKTSPTLKKRPSSLYEVARFKKKEKRKKLQNIWWRISDDKVKESKTEEVLSMQKEVYLLFYELMPEGDAAGDADCAADGEDG